MVVTIVGALEDHISLSQRRPRLSVLTLPTRAGVNVLRWIRVYTGSEPDSPHALALAGRLIRARNDAGTIYTESTNALFPSGSWTSTATGTTGTGVALAAITGEAILLYVDGAGLNLQMRSSTDDGQTWSSATLLVTEASAIGSVALAYNPNGDLCAFYTLGTTTTLKRLRRTSGVWAGSGTSWTRSGSVASLTGVAVTHDGADFCVMVTGTEVTTTNPRVYATRMGDLGLPANAWGSLTAVAEADALSTTTFTGPGLAMIGQDARGAFTVNESGHVAFARAFTSHPLHLATVQTQWSEGEPHEATGIHGIALAAFDFAPLLVACASRPDGFWLGIVYPSQDLGDRVLSCSYDVELERSRCRVVLNDRGSYIAGGGFANTLFAGATISIAPGYDCGADGDLFGVVQDFTIDRITYEEKAGRLTVTVDGIGAWELLDRWRAPQVWQTAAGAMTRDAIFQRIAARAGLSWSHGTSPAAPSSDWSAYSPAFAIAAGESAASVLKRLLAVVPDFVRASGAGLEVLGPTTSDSNAAYYSQNIGLAYSAWSAVGEDGSLPNWTRVQGPDRYADAFDFGADGPHGVYQQGPMLRELRNLDATTDPKATSWAANALRRLQVERVAGQLVAPFHPALQLLDRITVDHDVIPAQAGHIVAIGLRYERNAKAPRYDVVITLGGD